MRIQRLKFLCIHCIAILTSIVIKSHITLMGGGAFLSNLNVLRKCYLREDNAFQANKFLESNKELASLFANVEFLLINSIDSAF